MTYHSSPFSKQHVMDSEACPECWPDYPVLHGDGCNGLVHAEFGDEDYDGDYWLLTYCGECGRSQ